jgi:hypothetical protein
MPEQEKVREAALKYVAEVVKADPKVGRTSVISVDLMAKEVAAEAGFFIDNARDVILDLIEERKVSWRLFRYTSEIHAIAAKLRGDDHSLEEAVADDELQAQLPEKLRASLKRAREAEGEAAKWKDAALKGAKVLCPFDADCATAQLHEKVAKLTGIVGEAKGIIEWLVDDRSDGLPLDKQMTLKGWLKDAEEVIGVYDPSLVSRQKLREHLGVIMRDYGRDFQILANESRRQQQGPFPNRVDILLLVPHRVASRSPDLLEWVKASMEPPASFLREPKLFLVSGEGRADDGSISYIVQGVDHRHGGSEGTLVLASSGSGVTLEEVVLTGAEWSHDRDGAVTSMKLRFSCKQIDLSRLD